MRGALVYPAPQGTPGPSRLRCSLLGRVCLPCAATKTVITCTTAPSYRAWPATRCPSVPFWQATPIINDLRTGPLAGPPAGRATSKRPRHSGGLGEDHRGCCRHPGLWRLCCLFVLYCFSLRCTYDVCTGSPAQGAGRLTERETGGEAQAAARRGAREGRAPAIVMVIGSTPPGPLPAHLLHPLPLSLSYSFHGDEPWSLTTYSLILLYLCMCAGHRKDNRRVAD